MRVKVLANYSCLSDFISIMWIFLNFKMFLWKIYSIIMHILSTILLVLRVTLHGTYSKYKSLENAHKLIIYC